MSRYEELQNAVNVAQEERANASRRDKHDAATLKVNNALLVLCEYRRKAAGMHDELTDMLERVLNGTWSVEEVEQLINKARSV